MYKAYPYVNISLHAGTTPKHVDRLNESDHHEQSVSWKGDAFCSQLGIYNSRPKDLANSNSRPMGLANSNRLSFRTNSGYSSGQTNLINTVLCKTSRSYLADLSTGGFPPDRAVA